MSDTPRTDAVAIKRVRAKGWLPPGKLVVPASEMAKLETELAAKERELAEARASKESWRDMALAIDRKLTAAREAIRGAVGLLANGARYRDDALAKLRSALPANAPGAEPVGKATAPDIDPIHEAVYCGAPEPDAAPGAEPNRLVACVARDSSCPEWCDRQRPHTPDKNCFLSCSVHPGLSACGPIGPEIPAPDADVCVWRHVDEDMYRNSEGAFVHYLRDYCPMCDRKVKVGE